MQKTKNRETPLNLKRMVQFGGLPTLLLVLILSLFSSDVGATSDEINCNALIILNSTDVSSTKEAINLVKEKGGLVVHIFPPHILIGYVPENISQDLVGRSYIREIHYDQVDPSIVEQYGKIAVYGVDAWNNNFMGLAKAKGLTPKPGVPQPGPIMEDMKTVPTEAFQEELKKSFSAPSYSGKIYMAPYGAGFYDVSEYMIGNPDKSWNIFVGIIFPESDGLIETQTENWTGSQQSNVISEITNACNWWRMNNPGGIDLSFVYENQLVSTGYEPINHPNSQEELWIDDVMTNLGYNSGTYVQKVYTYDNYRRNSWNTDWAVTMFIVNSLNDADGEFSDGSFAYAYVGGPFLVMTYDNNGYGIGNMDAVCAHETGHIFYACDEYASNDPHACTVNHYSGYLNIQNGNHETGGITNDPCIMRGQVHPFTYNNICDYTKKQIGWRDTDYDWKHDITDTYPTSSLTPYSPDPTSDPTPTYTGSTHVNPYPNSNPYIHNPTHPRNNITVNTISQEEYRVDGGPWNWASADDGWFDEGVEGFNFTSSPLLPGTHIFEVRASNTTSWIVDNTEVPPYTSDQLTIDCPHLSGPVWNGNGGPLNAVCYRVVGNVTVPSGQTLTIDPGTKIFFKPGFKIIANGTLKADGDGVNPIYLISESEPHRGMKLMWDLVLKDGGEFKPGP